MQTTFLLTIHESYPTTPESQADLDQEKRSPSLAQNPLTSVFPRKGQKLTSIASDFPSGQNPVQPLLTAATPQKQIQTSTPLTANTPLASTQPNQCESNKHFSPSPSHSPQGQ
jgi:hypothetical protein